MSKEAPERVVDDPNVAMQNSPEFDQLRSKFRKFVFPLTALFLAWYFLYVLLSVFRQGLHGDRVVGNITWGLILGLLQFVSTFAITMVYARWADRVSTPRPKRLARRWEADVSALLTSAASLARAPRDDGRQPGDQHRHLRPLRRRHPRIVIRASRNNRSAADYYAGGRAFTGRQNGIAIAGDYLSAASFLGIAGAIAINGYDGFLYSIGFLVAWLVALLLVAELLRNVGKYTMADVLTSGCASARSASPRPSRRSSCRSSTCSPRWRAPADSWPSCSASRARSASGSSSSSSAS